MIKFLDSSKLYVYAPAGVVTGGSELLYQFVDLANTNGRDAYLVYYGEKKHEVPDDYRKYKVKIADKVIDTNENIVVIFEGALDKIRSINNAQVMIWWLSVDLMYHSCIRYLSLADLFKFSLKLGFKSLYLRIGHLLKHGENQFKHNISLKRLSKMNFTNAYQSVYAQFFLYKNGFSELVPLSDYINDEFFNENTSLLKQDIVLYNPKKGIKFTKKIIRSNPDIQFIPIKNLNRKGVLDLLRSAKVYIDFGFHPGKDRFPREAAVSGCIIITNKRGSAFYYEDVSIPSEYKFSNKTNVRLIGNKIRECLNNYEYYKNDMSNYIEKIKFEKNKFIHEAKSILIKTN